MLLLMSKDCCLLVSLCFLPFSAIHFSAFSRRSTIKLSFGSTLFGMGVSGLGKRIQGFSRAKRIQRLRNDNCWFGNLLKTNPKKGLPKLYRKPLKKYNVKNYSREASWLYGIEKLLCMHADNKKLRETVPRASTKNFRQELDGNYRIKTRIAIAKITFYRIQKWFHVMLARRTFSIRFDILQGYAVRKFRGTTRYDFCTEFTTRIPLNCLLKPP